MRHRDRWRSGRRKRRDEVGSLGATDIRGSGVIAPTFTRIDRAIKAGSLTEVQGTVSDIAGLVIEANGPSAAVGDICEVATQSGSVKCEVVGFRGERVLLMPLGELVGV